MRWREATPGFKIYMVGLWLVLAAVLVLSLRGDAQLGQALGAWIALSLFLAFSEYLALSFHGQGTRFSLSAAEAILLPMIMALSLPQVVIGATLANAVARPMRWKISRTQESFNVAQYGVAAAAGAATWKWLAGPGDTLSLGNVAVGALGVLVFAVTSHVLVGIAVSLAQKGRFSEFVRAIDLPSFILNLAGNLSLGLLFAAAYAAARWTVVLFALPLGALYFGYRAILRQSRERERVEHLHSASRALASSPDLGDTLIGFLEAVAEIGSALEARAVIPISGQLRWTGVREKEVLGHMQPLVGEWIGDVFDQVRALQGPVSIGKDEAETGSDLPVQSLLAVPLMDGDDVIGCVAVIDRVGPEGFGSQDEQLMEALVAELALSLGSYRLFSEVQEERERFGRIFLGSKEGICLIDARGVVQAWNPALERISGYPASAVMGKVWSDVVVLRDKGEVRVTGDELVGVEPDEELELVTKNGPSRWISTLAGPVGDKESAGWAVLIRDVTAEHEVEAAKSDFLSTISHELRTPLTTIKGSLQVLGRGPETLPPQLAEQMIGVTTRGAERLERLVMNLLAVSQIESGTMSVFPDEVSLDALVRDKAESMLQGHDRVVIEGDDGPLVVRADRERVGHAVEHLLENAMKFGGPQGEIRIEIRKDNGYGRVSVSDEGPGIPAGDRQRIFERFVRLGDVLTRETQGAGVGLFIAMRSIEAMGGSVWVDSEVGKGSTFHLTVPLAKPMAVEDQADTA